MTASLRWRLIVVVSCVLPFAVAAVVSRDSGRVLHSYAPLPSAFAIAAGFIGVVVGTSLLVFAVFGRRHGRALAAERAAADARAHDERRRLLGRLDHEIKNPLTAIRAGLANVAAEEVPGRSDGSLRSVDAQVTRLARLLGDLRSLSELETREIELVPVDLTALLAEVAEATDDLAAESGSARTVRLTLPQAPWPLPPVPGDRDLLFLAFHNLTANALKFSDPSDVIEIRATDEGGYVTVEVADTGMGIPADEVETVWGELARGREAPGIPGSGLGLSFVRVVADRHRGSVQLRSRHGAGTVVRIDLPTA
jgi:two-component system, OmpR family, sensor kinase